MATMADFRADKATWCPGCGDFTVLASLQRAAVNSGLEPEDMAVVSGIGCSGKISQHFGSYGLHSLHGRSIPAATGVKLANHHLTVVAAGGDGDGYGIGLGHFIHALRRNIDITYIVMDNHIYGLTTGQTSPTSRKGFLSKTSPQGSAEEPIRPLETALVNGCTFVAQAFSGDVKQMTSLIEQGMRHKGFALINAFSPCVTFNKVNTYEWFKENIVNLDTREDYKADSRIEAIRIIQESNNLVTGLLYKEDRPAYHEVMTGASEQPSAHQDLQAPRKDAEKLLAQFR
jgi:2-oxoglutarate ferredoxin oxidoreductase subunit beta